LTLSIPGVSLHESLSKEGYKSYLVQGVTKAFGIMLEYYKPAFKFQYWIDDGNLDDEYNANRGGWGQHNNTLFRKCIDILEDTLNDKVFIQIKPVDHHIPYFTGGEMYNPPTSFSSQEKAISWLDYSLREFFEKLNRRGLFDDKTLIIVTSDHSELGSSDKNPLGAIPCIFVTKNHYFSKYKHLQDYYFSQVDLTPTLLNLLGLNKYLTKGMFGYSIFNASFPDRANLGQRDHLLYYRYKGEELFRIDLEKKDSSSLSFKEKVILKFYYKTQLYEVIKSMRLQNRNKL
jgi:phosphoglycerol transferase MdoB-like AlkP superfamily enzyme